MFLRLGHLAEALIRSDGCSARWSTTAEPLPLVVMVVVGGGVFWGWGVVAGLFGDGRMGCPGRPALQGMGISRNLQQPSLAVIHL